LLSDLESQRVPRSEDVAVRVGQRIFHAWKFVLMSPERSHDADRTENEDQPEKIRDGEEPEHDGNAVPSTDDLLAHLAHVTSGQVRP
jgi:hypothetical protein